MLGEKLRSIGHDPVNVQVVVQSDNVNDTIYVVDGTSVISCMKHMQHKGHVTDGGRTHCTA